MKELIGDGKKIRNKTLVWLESLRKKDKYGRYRICNEGGESLFTSCAAVFIRDLLGDLKDLSDKQREEWVEYIKSKQDPETGYFCNINLKQDDFKGLWESNYVIEEATKFSVIALSILGSNSFYRVKALEPFHDKKILLDWLKSLDWKESWFQSNRIMFKLSLLIDDFERNGSTESKDSVLFILDWLDSWQDSETGLWATDLGVSKYHCVFTTFHFLFFYFYLKRPVQYISQLIDSVLSIQNRSDGLFSPDGGGGACPDLDAVDILVKCSMVVDYRKEDIEKALGKAFYGLIRNQNEDGGFCWARKWPFTPVEWVRSFPNIIDKNSRSMGIYTAILWMLKTHFLPMGYLRRYDNLEYLGYYSTRSNIFSTWFRLLALALIDTRYPGKYVEGINWKFSKKAGLGWHSNKI